ncbi:site-2 protease family protein [Methylophilaceae bacterium]|mgnify:FL=1|jgi:Zn-dependent protease|nr:site-2 protease family protein [Methylophilaceae bacterium]MDA9221909.1 site-2 protease family protein [Methylophilaceae bacterium]MDA9913927.1 site-2 protease family protein [Methylophilaceae bacterium]MDC0626352.1 site-2 protease family protein [Methylophilaceae bacterium]NCV37729.1 site-2 protease family protein [Betaproteobacteria bacterium]
MELSPIQYFTISIIPVLLAITVHEAAHGYAAKHFGDKTAYYLGRITLNPIKHIDPLGTVVIPGMLLLLSAPFLFGWAKPVPVNFSNLNNPKKDMMWVALAGPASNLVMAIIWAIILGLFKSSGTSYALFVIGMAQVGIMINLVLMLLNLLPIPPLDGGRMAVSLLPSPWSYKLASIERYGMFILIFLIVSGLLSAILLPLLRFFQGTLIGIFV